MSFSRQSSRPTSLNCGASSMRTRTHALDSPRQPHAGAPPLSPAGGRRRGFRLQSAACKRVAFGCSQPLQACCGDAARSRLPLDECGLED